MTNNEKADILKMRFDGCSYAQIAEKVQISENTIKSFCRRQRNNKNIVQNVESVNYDSCNFCHEPLTHLPKKRRKKFCSNQCRIKFWYQNLDKSQVKSKHFLVCASCTKEFKSYGNKSRRYCCHKCYINHRFSASTKEKI